MIGGAGGPIYLVKALVYGPGQETYQANLEIWDIDQANLESEKYIWSTSKSTCPGSGQIDFEVDQIDFLDFEIGPADFQAGPIDQSPHRVDRASGASCRKPPVRDGQAFPQPSLAQP